MDKKLELRRRCFYFYFYYLYKKRELAYELCFVELLAWLLWTVLLLSTLLGYFMFNKFTAMQRTKDKGELGLFVFCVQISLHFYP